MRRQRCLDWLEKHSAAGWGVVVAARGVEADGATLAEARREAVPRRAYSAMERGRRDVPPGLLE